MTDSGVAYGLGMSGESWASNGDGVDDAATPGLGIRLCDVPDVVRDRGPFSSCIRNRRRRFVLLRHNGAPSSWCDELLGSGDMRERSAPKNCTLDRADRSVGPNGICMCVLDDVPLSGVGLRTRVLMGAMSWTLGLLSERPKPRVSPDGRRSAAASVGSIVPGCS